MNSAVEQWIELEQIFSTATKREQNIDLRCNIDWQALEQVTWGAALAGGLCVNRVVWQKRGEWPR